MRAENITRKMDIARGVVVADGIFSRMKGLLGKSTMQPGDGLLIRPCNAVHTIGMRFPIDVIFLDKKNRVVATARNLVPNRMTRLFFSAKSVLEVPAGTVDMTMTETGDQIEFA